MMKWYERLTLIAGVTLFPVLFWLGGFDFNKRGDVAVGCFLLTVFSTIASLMFIFFWRSGH